jgi:hypothetical protein
MIPQTIPIPIEIGRAEKSLANGPHPRMDRTTGKMAPSSAPIPADSKKRRLPETPCSARAASHQLPADPTTNPKGAAGIAANTTAIGKNSKASMGLCAFPCKMRRSTTARPPRSDPIVAQKKPPMTATINCFLTAIRNAPARCVVVASQSARLPLRRLNSMVPSSTLPSRSDSVSSA